MGNQIKDETIVSCLKNSLLGFNCVLWLNALLMLLLTLWFMFGTSNNLAMPPNDFSENWPHLLIGVSVLMLMVTSIAFVCIIKGQPALMHLYSGLLFCMIFIDGGISAILLGMKQAIAKVLHDGMERNLANYSPKSALDVTQEMLQCCGVSNYTDWVKSSPQKVIPTSCCINKNSCITANYSDVFQKGCFNELIAFLQTHMHSIYSIVLFLVLFPAIGIVMSCVYVKYIKKVKYVQ